MVLLSYSPCCVSNRLQPAEIAFNLRKSVKNQMASSSLHSQSFAEIFVDFTNGPPPQKKRRKNTLSNPRNFSMGSPALSQDWKNMTIKKKGFLAQKSKTLGYFMSFSFSRVYFVLALLPYVNCHTSRGPTNVAKKPPGLALPTGAVTWAPRSPRWQATINLNLGVSENNGTPKSSI